MKISEVAAALAKSSPSFGWREHKHRGVRKPYSKGIYGAYIFGSFPGEKMDQGHDVLLEWPYSEKLLNEEKRDFVREVISGRPRL